MRGRAIMASLAAAVVLGTGSGWIATNASAVPAHHIADLGAD
jgi:hypothetical protein